MFKNKILSFVLFFFSTYSASVIGGLATIGFKEPWYSLLDKPSFNPPDWVFGPIWTTLYLMMTIAIWKFWHSKDRNMNTVYIYFIHLLVNASWSVVFFALHQIFLALVVIIVILLLVLWLIKLYYPINKLSSFLMVPYLAWLVFAFILNLNILLLN